MNPRGGRRAKRSLGQNFLIDPNLQRKIVDELEASADETVLEVGPGHGELSRHLVGRTRRLVLVEKDAELAAGLREAWPDRADVEVVEGDALELDLRSLVGRDEPLAIVSNLPYNLTSPLLFAFLGLRPPARRLVVMVQREVAERIVAEPGGKTYGALSVGIRTVADARLAFRVGRGAFRPRPDVESAVVVIDPDPSAVESVSRVPLRRLTRAAFGRRRKQIQKILRSAPELGFSGDVDAFLATLAIDPKDRPEDLSPETFVRLARALTEKAR